MGDFTVKKYSTKWTIFAVVLFAIALAFAVFVRMADAQSKINYNDLSHLPTTYTANLSTPFANGPTYFFGDSTSTIGNSHASIPQNSGTALLWKDIPGGKASYGVSGTRASSIAASQLLYFAPPLNNAAYAMPKVFANGGINDANNCATTNCIANYAAEQSAGIAWMLSPNKVMASAATITGFSSSATLPLNAGVVGTAEKSTTNGNTLSFSVTPTGTKVGITFIATAASGGTFTVAIDGTQKTGCTGSTTWNSSGCGTAVDASTPMRLDFTTTAAAHTVLITVTSATNAANPVEILDVDGAPTSVANQPVVFQYGVLYQNADASSTATAAFNTSVAATTAALFAENLNVRFIDLRGGTPGVNSTTDMATSSASCGATSNTPLHPNDCGYANEVKTIEAQVIAYGYNMFLPNAGGTVGPHNASYPYQTSPPTSPTFADFWNTDFQIGPNGGWAPTTTASTPGIAFFPMVTHLSAAALMWDAVNSRYMTGFFGDFAMGFLHCGGTVTNYSTCTPYFTVDASGNVNAPIWTASQPLVTDSSKNAVSLTYAAMLSNLLGNPAIGVYSINCTSTSSCGNTAASGGSSGTFAQSSSVNAAITATTLVSSVPSTPGMYKLDWTVSLSVVGVACTGPAVITLNDIFTDPLASGSVTNPIGTIALTIPGAYNGTLGYIASGSETILAKNATAIQYSTTYTNGAGCTTQPKYQVSYEYTAIH